jgi:hypothetical protein
LNEETPPASFPQYPPTQQPGIPVANRDQVKPLAKIIRRLFNTRSRTNTRPFPKSRSHSKANKKKNTTRFY